MKTYSVSQAGRPLAHRVAVANSFFSRFRGLMLRKTLAPGEGMLLKNCSAIHCCFMRFPIDVLYLDNEMRVVGKETVTPWHLGSVFPGAKHVLELNAGTTEEITLWQPLEWKERITP